MKSKLQEPTPIDDVTSELLDLHDKPGPRYTSYPTAVEFSDKFTESEYQARLAQANAKADEPLSLYIHIPFCERRCSFCGCNVIISKRRELADEYLKYLFKEIDLLASRLPNRRRLVQYHWGGGTPTYLNLEQIAALQGKVKEHFELADNGEVAVEVDPDVTTVEQLSLLRELGFNRLSIGVQDFNPKVLEAVNRAEAEDKTRLLLGEARRLGFESVNMDLIYGLPHQTPESYEETLDKIVEMRPDRLAVYSFAYVPWIKGNQKKLPMNFLPDRNAKFALFAQAIRKCVDGGYLQIGMDHFALPEDEMGRAVSTRTLYRNFMGYTVHKASSMLGVGVSSIGALEGVYAQNVKKTKSYYKALDEGRFPIEKGYVLSEDDLVRQRVITELMCNFYVGFKEIEKSFGVKFDNYFKDELTALNGADGPVSQGFVRVFDNGIEITPLGRVFIRNVCMIFDRYMKEKEQEKRVFSNTV